ncbi:MAG: ribosome maturation factor RimM [Pseudomonadota bacterium]
MTKKAPSPDERRVCLGAIAGAHGVRGAVRIKSFTEMPEAVAAYGPVTSEDGARHFTLQVTGLAKQGIVIATAPEITSREDAEALKSVRLYVARLALDALDEDEFYLDDLVGLTAIDEDGAPFGQVSAVFNFGADDLIELDNIPDVNGKRLFAFTKENAPLVDISARRITVRRDAINIGDDPPAGDGAPSSNAPEK